MAVPRGKLHSINLEAINTLVMENCQCMDLKYYTHCFMGMQDLKSEALRPRHWDKLMKETEKSFDMDPKTFTLANLFRMELHKFASVIR